MDEGPSSRRPGAEKADQACKDGRPHHKQAERSEQGGRSTKLALNGYVQRHLPAHGLDDILLQNGPEVHYEGVARKEPKEVLVGHQV